MLDEIRELATMAVRCEDTPVAQEALLTALYRCRRESWTPTRQPTVGYKRIRISASGVFYGEYRRRVA